jgi:hypothetical protein
MSAAASLAVLFALLLGGAGGWLIAQWSHRRAAELQRAYEHDVTDEELALVLARLRRAGRGSIPPDDDITRP